MSGGQIKVGQGGLDALIADMMKGVADLRSTLADMGRNLRPHMDEWDGGAKEAYRVAQERWNTEIEDLNEILMDVKMAVSESQQEYLAGELANQKSWG